MSSLNNIFINNDKDSCKLSPFNKRRCCQIEEVPSKVSSIINSSKIRSCLLPQQNRRLAEQTVIFQPYFKSETDLNEVL